MGLVVKEIIKIAENRLAEAGVASPKVDAELLFRHVMNMDKVKYFMSWGTQIGDNACENYFQVLDVRCSGVPLQYITGHQEFMGFDFKVTRDVLIPRQDTEVLVSEVIALANGESTYVDAANVRKVKKVLDLCTGSGAIAVSIAKLLRSAEVTASDISEGALSVARENARENEAKVEFEQGDLFAPFKRKIGSVKFDLIVSNPPYIKSEDIEGLMVEVKDHEPRLALDGGGDGLDFYKRIIEEAPRHLRKKGALALEIGCDQAEDILALAAAQSVYHTPVIIKDLAGLDRVALLVLK